MSSLQQQLSQMHVAKQFEPFITHIRFPKYKNLAPNTRIEFNHPITVIVGANGTNKSSVLRALYGVPDYSNLGMLWFSTSIDPIEEGDGERNCFIYGHFNQDAKRVTEVLKIRIKKDEDPDYWEPSRPYAKYEMEMIPRVGTPPPGAGKTRWNPIKKKMEYVDFRASLSAFDKFFYYGELRDKSNTQKDKKDFIRARAPHLKRAADQGLTTLSYRKSDRIVNSENTLLNAEELAAVSRILGRQYSEIRLIRHRFYNADGYTARMRTADFSYTEAFAGSGEFSIVKLVATVMKCEPRTLILLDEPEVSLHPGAQDRLMTFLSEQAKKHKHQIVISTHSPALLRTLPPQAIKVMGMDPVSGKIGVIRQAALPEEAFFHLGEPATGKKRVVVEDRLAKSIVEKSLRPLGQAIFDLFDVTFFPGGCKTLWSFYIPIFAAEDRDDVVVFLDGDQKPNHSDWFPASDEIPVGDDDKLGAIIKQATGVDVNFPVDGTGGKSNNEQRVLAQRTFIRWSRSRVGFMPGVTPEQFVWHNAPDASKQGIAGSDYKKNFADLARKELGLADFEEIQGDAILHTQRRLLSLIKDEDVGLAELRDSLYGFLQ
ncbi:AAA family ATPase [Massilia antarctica]|uniref:AAA family ATPase n=1 Tax=Massilia antarctica TaxID=2765360 RepID=A0AA49A9E2_9BURK|nr:ATP-binding protein [Massilia antarctica]QPI51121.1 AAA family ATPase [Massilia antarctica]